MRNNKQAIYFCAFRFFFITDNRKGGSGLPSSLSLNIVTPRAHRVRTCKTEREVRKNGTQKKKKRGGWPAEPSQPGKKKTNSQKYM